LTERVDKKYKKKAWQFSILGYVYIAAIVLAVSATAALIVFSAAKAHGALYVAFKVITALGVFLFIIFRALWVKFEKPEGMEVNEGNVPELAEFIAQLGAEVGGPKNYRILLTDDLNASIVQYPRLGIFGWYQNYVIVGVPLLMVASVEEIKGILAHEFGHLKETHGIWAVKIHRNREVWIQIVENLEAKDHWGAFLFKRFFKWYLPKLDEYSYSLRREHEFEADGDAIRVAGKDAFGGALLKFEIYADRISNCFWKETFMKMQTCNEPAEGIFEKMACFLKETVDVGYQQKVIERELRAATDDRDTHPSIKERLKAAGYDPASFEMRESDAADLLLGEKKNEIVQELSIKWKEGITPFWEHKYDEFQALQAELRELEAAGEDSEGDFMRAAEILEELDREQEALGKYEKVLEINPENLEALFSKGRILIANEGSGAEGKEIIDKVMATDNEYSYYGTRLVYGYLLQQGRKEESKAYYEKGMTEAARIDEAMEERDVLKYKDSLAPHGLESDQVGRIIEQLAGMEKIKELYLVRKEVAHYSEVPLYVLGVRFRGTPSEKYIMNTVNEIAQNVDFPGETLVVPLNGDNSLYYRKHKKVENSLIFKKS